MAWVVRNGRRYWYRSVRYGRRVVREYVGTGPLAELEARRDAIDRQRADDAAADVRASLAAYRARLDALAETHAVADALLRAAVNVLLTADGYHRPRRNRWRKRRAPTMASDRRKLNLDLAALMEQVSESGVIPDEVRPCALVEYRAPKTDPESAEVFRRARAGEVPEADLEKLVRDKGWARWIGDIAQQGTAQLIRKATDYDPVWGAGVSERVAELKKQVLGDRPDAVVEMVGRRVLNSWLLVARLELEQTLRPPRDRKAAEHLDRAITRAQRRLMEAVRSLETVRRLKKPQVVQQVNVSAGPQQVNNAEIAR